MNFQIYGKVVVAVAQRTPVVVSSFSFDWTLVVVHCLDSCSQNESMTVVENLRRNYHQNMTLDEASEFWDEHSFLDYEDVREVHFSVDLRKNRNYIDIREDLAKQIRAIAHQKGTSSRVLINQ